MAVDKVLTYIHIHEHLLRYIKQCELSAKYGAKTQATTRNESGLIAVLQARVLPLFFFFLQQIYLTLTI